MPSGYFLVTKAPNEAYALTNSVVLNPNDISSHTDAIIVNNSFVFSVLKDSAVPKGNIATSSFHRTWAKISINEQVSVQKTLISATITSLTIQIQFLKKSITNDIPFNTDELSNVFFRSLSGKVFSLHQVFAFEFQGINLQAQVVEILCNDGKSTCGKLLENSPNQAVHLAFQKAPESLLKLKGSLATCKSSGPSIFKSDVNLQNLGIGGLDEEFNEILRRAFASRILPAHLTAQDFGMHHVKGLMLFGPPGTGKTLLARQIGSMLNTRLPPKIVSGPEILNKYVGESEENIRKLFKEAEAEYKAKGEDSQLHIIIFDEIDAICRQRSAGRGEGKHPVYCKF